MCGTGTESLLILHYRTGTGTESILSSILGLELEVLHKCKELPDYAFFLGVIFCTNARKEKTLLHIHVCWQGKNHHLEKNN
jgi:hypothetical protein